MGDDFLQDCPFWRLEITKNYVGKIVRRFYDEFFSSDLISDFRDETERKVDELLLICAIIEMLL